jgi:hypothetical protein
MPISAHALFSSIGLTIKGSVRWGQRLPCNSAGVYAVSLSDDPDRNDRCLARAPISADLVRAWIAAVSGFTFDGVSPPEARDVVSFLERMWLPDESIVYLGKATCLRNRIGQFGRHRLGDRKPHAGGHWLKTLSNLNELNIFFCECNSVAQAELKEQEALGVFVAQVSDATKSVLYNVALPIPFANREYPGGLRKQSMIAKDVNRHV